MNEVLVIENEAAGIKFTLTKQEINERLGNPISFSDAVFSLSFQVFTGLVKQETEYFLNASSDEILSIFPFVVDSVLVAFGDDSMLESMAKRFGMSTQGLAYAILGAKTGDWDFG